MPSVVLNPDIAAPFPGQRQPVTPPRHAAPPDAAQPRRPDSERATPLPRQRAAGRAAAPPPKLRIHAREQWASTTSGRITTDPFTWMQAVHWVVGTGAYTPDRTHGPRMGTTTVQVAQVLAELNPCRPGVEYLTRRTGLSRRTVQYHLEMLRESGLLAYVVKGTRVRGARPRASEFVRTIPAAYDTALGIRTRGTGPTRRVIGIADEGRALVAKLAKKAARKVRRTRRTKRTTHPAKQPAAARARCTPMEGGCSRS